MNCKYDIKQLINMWWIDSYITLVIGIQVSYWQARICNLLLGFMIDIMYYEIITTLSLGLTYKWILKKWIPNLKTM